MNERNSTNSPLHKFEEWFAEANASSGLEFPNAMSLATSNAENRPSVRMVLLKGLSKQGFLFFTNYESRKALELAQNPFAALCFHWEKIQRSVRVEGKVEKTSHQESEQYFNSRPRLSRIGAWASPQSREISSRSELEEKVREVENQFQGRENIPLPPHWGGYCLVPEKIEFWTNRMNRLHERILYINEGNNNWSKKLLAP